MDIWSTNTAVLDDVVIADNSNDSAGGGVYAAACDIDLTDVIVSNNTATEGGGLLLHSVDASLVRVSLTENEAASGGGGMMLIAADAVLIDVTISGNTAATGGGLRLSDSNVEVTGSLISGNSADGHGGGLYVLGTGETIDIDGSDFVDNTAGNEGGGTYAQGVVFEVDESTLSGNTAGTNGGGVYVAFSWPGSYLSDVIFEGNEAGGFGGGLRVQWDSRLDLEDVLFSGNFAGGDGGGISASSDPALVLDGVQVLDNEAVGNGGGMYLGWLDSCELHDVVSAGNTAGGGGGGINLYALYDTPYGATLDNVLIADNLGLGGSGGIALAWATAELTNVRILGNTGPDGGIAMWTESSVDMSNGAIVGNHATFDGGAVNNSSGYVSTFTNVDISENVADDEGGGIYIGSTGVSATVSRSNAWNNTPDDYAGMPDPTGMSGNISQDPQYLDVSSADPLAWDLHLATASPLVDAGYPLLLDPDASQSDIGAYGGPGAEFWDLDGDGYFDWYTPGPWPGAPWDCDDLDPDVYPGNGC